MADEDLTLNEDQLLDNLDDANGDGDLLTAEVIKDIALLNKFFVENTFQKGLFRNFFLL